MPMSDEPEIPADVRQLLAGKVDSVEKVEVMFLTWREPSTTWTVVTAAERLRLPVDSVGTALDELTADGLLKVEGLGYRYGAAGAEHTAVSTLGKIYEGDRLLVLREMTSLAMERIRSSAARAFSDAFRFRRREPGKGGSDA
jgi:hypothetical protein